MRPWARRRPEVPAAPIPSPATARQLRTLRLRLAALLGALVLAVVAVFAAAVIRLDDQLRVEQDDAFLLREVDDITRELAFIDGELDPVDPTALLDGSAAVGVRPDFDVFEIVDQQDLWDRFPEPSDEELDILIDEIFFGLDEVIQDEVLAIARVEGADRDEEIDNLLADPTDELIDEAYRVYLVDTATELGIELESPMEVFVSPGLDDAHRQIEEVLAAMADGDASGRFSIDVDDRSIGVRGTVLRDGPEVRGAVVAFIDIESSEAAHRQLRNRVLLVAAALVVCSALAAWWLAGRSIDPAAVALGQQERFLSAAAHELRTPITAIRVTAEAPLEPGADATAPLRRVAELAAGASHLTDDLLTLARMDADRVELATAPTRLDLLVEAAVDADPAIRLDLAPVVADSDVSLLTRAVENLLTNAVVHGGANAETPATITVDERGVTIADCGPGIPAVDREAVFERFRAGSRSPGHGLGLPLARWIARAHGGDLRVVESEQGAVLRLSLPTRPTAG